MKSVVLLLLVTLTSFTFAKGNAEKHKRYFLWLDASSNYERLGDEQGVIKILDKAKASGFTDVIADLRGIDGLVLYKSQYASQYSGPHSFKRSDDYDYPAVIIKQAHRAGLGIYFAMNVFAEGDKETKIGDAYSKHPEWQVQVYTKKGIVPISESEEEIAAFINPILPEVRAHISSIIKEMLNKYNPDGIILDRARYPNLSADFSTASRESFESFIGNRIQNWPEDIYKLDTSTTGKTNRIPGIYYKKWLLWRAKVIHDFFEETKASVKNINPKIDFSVYVGAWYPLYYDLGVNWASNKYHPEKEYDWADSSYYKTGYAELLDFIFTGNYFYDVEEKEAIETYRPNSEPGRTPEDYSWYSVEGSAKLARRAISGATPFYGSLYVQQYLDKNNPQQFVKAMKELVRDTDGLMIFDVVHLEENDWWKYVEEAIK